MSAPRIRAKFQLDSKGEPLATVRNDLKHYKIQLSMVDVPEDTYAVTYRLHETYYNPTREVRRDTPNFAEPITSYGDYVVQAEIRTKKSSDFTAVELSRALKETYGVHLTPSIRKAIEDIEAK